MAEDVGRPVFSELRVDFLTTGSHSGAEAWSNSPEAILVAASDAANCKIVEVKHYKSYNAQWRWSSNKSC